MWDWATPRIRAAEEREADRKRTRLREKRRVRSSAENAARRDGVLDRRKVKRAGHRAVRAWTAKEPTTNV